MEKDFLKELTELGILIEPKAIEILKDNPDLLDKIKKLENKPFIVTEEFLGKMLGQTDFKLKILSKEDKVFYSIKDFTDIYVKKYTILKNYLVKRLELKTIVSIAHVTNNEETSVIGLVKTKTNDFAEIEDTTGIIKIIPKEEAKEKFNNIKEDDVLGVHGIVKDNIIIADNIIWPDVPINYIKKTELPIKVIFINNVKITDQIITKFQNRNNYFILINCENQENFLNIYKNKTMSTNLEEPAYMEIDNLTILLAKDINSLDSIKRRYFKSKLFDFVIEPIPDVFFVTTNENKTENYKGVILISSKPNSIVEIDAQNRTTNTINLE